MSEWKEYKLGDLISIKGGFSYKGEYIGTGDKFLLGMGCVSYSKTFLQSGARPYSGDCSDRFYAKPFDIVLATRQQSDNLPILGLPAIIPQSFWGEKVIVGTNLYKVDNYSEVNNKYLYWLMRSPNYINYIHSCSKGSTVKMITKDAVESFVFMCPPKEERDFISGLLWQIEDKIDLLNRQNQTLESMAEALFRHYFIDNTQPDWKDGVISDLIDFNPTRKLTKNTVAPFLEMSELSTRTYAPNGWYERVFTSGTKFQNGDTLLARITPCLENGKTAYVDFLKENQVGWGSTEYIVMRPKEIIHPFFAYVIAKYKDFRDFAESCMSGSSGRQRVDVENLKSYECKIPDRESINRFNTYTKLAVEKMNYNNTQICTLTKLRDTLLPKLMNGRD